MSQRIEKSSTFAPAKKDDLVAQQVEHHTFNVGVLGSSPSQVTKRKRVTKKSKNALENHVFDFALVSPSEYERG